MTLLEMMMQIPLSNRDFRLMDEARIIARDFAERSIKHGAIVADRNRIISYGVNRLKTHPVMKQYGNHTCTVHAELSAIIRAGNVKGLTLYSARDIKGEFGNSKPCMHCMKLIIESGIKTVVYFQDGTFTKERL